MGAIDILGDRRRVETQGAVLARAMEEAWLSGNTDAIERALPLHEKLIKEHRGLNRIWEGVKALYEQEGLTPRVVESNYPTDDDVAAIKGQIAEVMGFEAQSLSLGPTERRSLISGAPTSETTHTPPADSSVVEPPVPQSSVADSSPEISGFHLAESPVVIGKPADEPLVALISEPQRGIDEAEHEKPVTETVISKLPPFEVPGDVRSKIEQFNQVPLPEIRRGRDHSGGIGWTRERAVRLAALINPDDLNWQIDGINTIIAQANPSAARIGAWKEQTKAMSAVLNGFLDSERSQKKPWGERAQQLSRELLQDHPVWSTFPRELIVLAMTRQMTQEEFVLKAREAVEAYLAKRSQEPQVPVERPRVVVDALVESRIEASKEIAGGTIEEDAAREATKQAIGDRLVSLHEKRELLIQPDAGETIDDLMILIREVSEETGQPVIVSEVKDDKGQDVISIVIDRSKPRREVLQTTPATHPVRVKITATTPTVEDPQATDSEIVQSRPGDQNFGATSSQGTTIEYTSGSFPVRDNESASTVVTEKEVTAETIISEEKLKLNEERIWKLAEALGSASLSEISALGLEGVKIDGKPLRAFALDVFRDGLDQFRKGGDREAARQKADLARLMYALVDDPARVLEVNADNQYGIQILDAIKNIKDNPNALKRVFGRRPTIE